MNNNILTMLGITSPLLIITVVILYLILQRAIIAKFDIMKTQEINNVKNDLDKDLESFKSQMNSELESTKHQLQLDYAKQSIVFDKQKESFSQIIGAIENAKKSLLKRKEYDEPWVPIKWSDVEQFQGSIAAQVLYIDSECDRLLSFFITEMYRASHGPDYVQPPQDKEIEYAFRMLEFLSIKILEHFRKLLGIKVDNDPILDVDLYYSCVFIKEFNFTEKDYLTKRFMKIDLYQSQDEIVEIAHKNYEGVCEELSRIVEEYTSNENTTHIFLGDDKKKKAEELLSRIRKT
jgi:hypothetical protein